MSRTFIAFRNDKLITLQIVLLIGVSLLLRLAGLGYSNFQGDELNTLCKFSDYASPGQFLAYLLEQRKGPVQFLITCTYSMFDPTFSSEFALRLPFALANLLALACLFILVYRLFTLQIAIYASFLFAVNGIFIAFARIVQYQSFVLLGGLAGLLALTLAVKYEKWRVPGLYVGFISTAFSLLAHFDAAFFMPPMAVLTLHWWMKFRNQPDFPRLRIHLIAAVLLFMFLVLAFYVEYALHLGPYQLNYWENRFTGDSTNFLRLFQFYNPGPVLWLGWGWVILGLTRIRNSLSWQVLLAWLLPPIIFMALIFNDSRTHSYTYLLPLFVVAGIGIDAMIGWIHSLLRGKSVQIAQTIVLSVFLIFSYLSYEIFIDHDPEYPWSPKRVLGINLKGGSLDGTFGFPYSREWRDIGRWFENLQMDEDVIVVTNEKRQFVSFYLPSRVSNRYKYSLPHFSEEIRAPHGLYILIIEKPQSWMYQLWGLNLDVWREKFVPLQDFVNEEGERVASVYFLTQAQIDAEFR
jgi:4-amino-4-deoxy-L-arabinose transferase-like glycosyltransferase